MTYRPTFKYDLIKEKRPLKPMIIFEFLINIWQHNVYGMDIYIKLVDNGLGGCIVVVIILKD